MNRLSDIITQLGVRRVARECGVTSPTVCAWKEYGLPRRSGESMDKRRAHYERVIARMAGMKVGELREWLAEDEAQAA